MATEASLNGTAQSPTRPITIGGRSDIAKVIFQDGHTISYPSMPSNASASSYSTTPSTLPSRSSSHKRGRRDRGASFSSTGSIRDVFSSMHMPSISDDTDHTGVDSMVHTDACSVIDTLPPLSSDHDQGETDEWGTATLRPGDFVFGDSAYASAAQNQDHLVARADGAYPDVPHRLSDIDKTFSDVVFPQKEDDVDDVFNNETDPNRFCGPQSAPPGPSWMAHARRSHPAYPMTAVRAGLDKPIDVSMVTSSKAIRKPGRAPGSKLPEEKRQKVAIMRRVGACNYCKEARRGCDPGTPCKPCILHFGPDVLDEPNHCRKDIVGYLCGQILSKVCKWHPYPREVTDFFGRDVYVADWRYEIPIQFGFGPPLRCSVCVLQTSEPSHFQHKHVHYPTRLATRPEPSHDFVLPVTFADPSLLFTAIDGHLSMLVDNHFRQFTFFTSRFQILDKIRQLYTHYRRVNHEHATLLHQCFKLFILTHDSEITVCMDDISVQHILANSSPGYNGFQRVTPCVLRAELGKVVPQLARLILDDILKKLLRMCLGRRCEQHPVVVACFALVMMIIESIMYHSSRIGYHAHTLLPGPAPRPMSGPENEIMTSPFESITHPVEAAAAMSKLESAASDLQTIYRNCFENCHNLLLRTIEERHFTALQKQFGDAPACFIAALNRAIHDSAGYLDARLAQKTDNLSDANLLFDRLLARLFLLQTGP